MSRLFLMLASAVSTRAAIAQSARSTAAPDTGAWQAPAGSRWYVAVEGVANPWIYDLVIAVGRVTGEARQRPADPALTEPSPPFQVLNATAVIRPRSRSSPMVAIVSWHFAACASATGSIFTGASRSCAVGRAGTASSAPTVRRRFRRGSSPTVKRFPPAWAARRRR